MFAVSQLIYKFEFETGQTVNASTYDKGCVGFMPVYKTRKQAEKAWPECELTEVSKVELEDGC